MLLAAFRAVRERADDEFRLVHYSVQSNHVHLLCEPRGRLELTRAMQSLATRIAKRLNALWRRAGTLFADRYHDHILRTPREVRHALAYVLENARRHGVVLPFDAPDPFSSAPWFDGSRRRIRELKSPPNHLSRAKTWLLSIGWSRHGPIDSTTATGET